MGDCTGDVSQLLRAWASGDLHARDALVPLVYHELRNRAAGYLRHERPDHTLQATALVHEAFMRLAGQDRVVWQNRGHFYAIAAQMMRRILVDYARERRAVKRPDAAQRTELDDRIPATEQPEYVLLLDEAADHLLSTIRTSAASTGSSRSMMCRRCYWNSSARDAGRADRTPEATTRRRRPF